VKLALTVAASLALAVFISFQADLSYQSDLNKLKPSLSNDKNL